MAKATSTTQPEGTSAKRNGPSIGGTCLFSGEPTKTKNALFLPGYDAKFKALLLRIYRGIDGMNKVRKAAIPLLQRPDGLCGFKLNAAGDKLTHIGNFKVAEKAKGTKKEKVAAPAAKAAPATKAKVKTTVKRRPAAEPVAAEDLAE